MDYYVQEYSRHGLQPTLNWYRTREVNFNDEKVYVRAYRPLMRHYSQYVLICALD